MDGRSEHCGKRGRFPISAAGQRQALRTPREAILSVAGLQTGGVIETPDLNMANCRFRFRECLNNGLHDAGGMSASASGSHIAVKMLQYADGGQRRGLGAQNPRSQADHGKTLTLGQSHFFSGEAPFRPHQQRDRVPDA